MKATQVRFLTQKTDQRKQTKKKGTKDEASRRNFDRKGLITILKGNRKQSNKILENAISNKKLVEFH